MRKKELFMCGAVLFALLSFILKDILPPPVWSGTAAGVCALLSAALILFGLRENNKEKIGAEKARKEETQRLLDSHRQEIENLHNDLEDILGELKCQSASAQAISEMLAAQPWDQVKAISGTVLDIHGCLTTVPDILPELQKASGYLDKVSAELAGLKSEIEYQGKLSKNYHENMTDRLKEKINGLADSDQIYELKDDVSDNLEKVREQIRKSADDLSEFAEALREEIRSMTVSIEKQNIENRDSMERIVNSYSNVTSQDIELLDRLAKEFRE